MNQPTYYDTERIIITIKIRFTVSLQLSYFQLSHSSSVQPPLYLHTYIQHTYIGTNILPEQQWVLHGIWWLLEPEQFFPRQVGSGLSHLLVAVSLPPPHGLLHGPFVHELHPPSTTEKVMS